MKNSFKAFIVVAAIGSFAFISPKNNETKQINVVIDAGHGGKDFGVTHDNFTEKEIVEKISNKIKALNTNKNIVIHLTRNDDSFVTLNERTDLVNKIKPDMLLSLHVNQVKNTTASGVRFFTSNEDNINYGKSTEMASKLSKKFEENHQINIGTISKAPLYVLKNAQVPAVMVELGFLTNENDRKWITNEKEQDRIAQTILEFIGEIE